MPSKPSRMLRGVAWDLAPSRNIENRCKLRAPVRAPWPNQGCATGFR
jgi:hypothetical protein